MVNNWATNDPLLETLQSMDPGMSFRARRKTMAPMQPTRINSSLFAKDDSPQTVSEFISPRLKP